MVCELHTLAESAKYMHDQHVYIYIYVYIYMYVYTERVI